MKGNSSNVFVSNVHCYESGCAVIGSMGSNAAQPDYVSNVYFDNVTCTHSSNAAWIKTYSGTGYVRNVTFANFKFTDVNQPIYVTPVSTISIPHLVGQGQTQTHTHTHTHRERERERERKRG
jgi:hypothetical protein